MVFADFASDYEEWFEFDYRKSIYVPKEGAPKEALEEYRKYIETIENMDKLGLN